MRFSDIAPDDPCLITDLLPVLQQLRPHLTPSKFREVYAEGHPQGLRFTAAYAGAQCVAVAGWRVMATTVCDRKLYIDDLVTAESARGQGTGKAMLDELAERARAAGCAALDLDSGVQRGDAHRFYMREGMAIVSFHFARLIG